MSNQIFNILKIKNLLRRMGLLWPADGYRRRINSVKKMQINQVQIRIPTFHGIACDASESWMIDLLTKVLRLRSGVFLDVGVNIGQTLVKIKAIESHREYIGFEPNPMCVYYVSNLVKINNFANCTVLPVGLFTHNGILSLDLFSDNATDSSASVIDNFRPDNKIHSKMFVPVFTFDSVYEMLGEKCFGIVKIDVEGAELEVVKSLLDMISRDRPIVLIELLPVYSRDNISRWGRQVELEQIFAGIGYTILRVGKTTSGDYTNLKPIDSIGIHSDLNYCDYVVVPGERLQELQEASGAPSDASANRQR